ncbi:carboxypeptidase-like regulatory domain-containing protein [Mucilaginibacter gracilis]|uniref:carboxypeptidase-like regulatory domain-containing protein n=1 Tax=Mucilaginibacter gracilis TaxID=423350 RepID=UPI001FE76B03|nr:carboxypeptidase-like regulatory domain-containing protein [Mucilaginibacter gracilis]
MQQFYIKLKLLVTLLLLAVLPNLLFAQSKQQLSGIVLDGDRAPLPGVSVLVKGSTKGVATDIEGKFIISANPGDVLVFKFIGSQQKEVEVTNQKVIEVTLLTDSKTLNEVVVTALGVKKEARTIGYSVQEVNGDDLIKARDPNPISGLTGKVAGLSVAPNAELLRSPNVLLRGSSISLYVVDGFPINTDTFDISPDDIETYTVLKGPTAAALYGSRAQAGAILITTKKGDKSKKGFTVNVNSSTVLNKGFLTFPRLQDSYGPGESTYYKFVDGKGGAPGGVDGDYDVWGPYFNGQLIPQYDSPVISGVRQGTPWVARGANNLDRFLQTGYQTNNNISLTANGDNYTTRFSLSDQHQQSYIPNNYLNIVNFNMYASFNPTSRIKIEGNLDFNRQYTDNFPDVDYGPNSLIYNIAIWTGADWDINAPDIKGEWQTGKTNIQSVFAEYQRYHNPWFQVNEWTRGHYKTNTTGYLSGNYKINNNLNATLRSQVNTYDLLRTEKMPYSAHPYGRENNEGDYREDRRNLFDNNTELFLNYNYTIKKFLNLSGLVGTNLRNFSYSSNWTSTDYLNVPAVYSFSNSKNPLQASSFNAGLLTLSEYLSLDAGFGRYATFSYTIRNEKSSAFQTTTSYSYPSYSLSTVLTDYLSIPKAISFLKLRGSYAEVRGADSPATIGPAPFSNITALGGGANKSNPLFSNPLDYGQAYASPYNGPGYSLLSSYTTSKPYNNQAAGYGSDALYQQGIVTSDRTNYEGGFDIKFLNNRLGFSGTAFRYIDGPQILQNAISSASGYSTLYLNALKTQTTGLEASLSGTPIKTKKGFGWDVVVNWSTNKTIYKELPPGQTYYLTNYTVNERIDDLYGTDFVRSPTGAIIFDAAGKPITPTRHAQLLGHAGADFSWSLINKFHYKSLSLGFQFDGSVGGVIADYMFNKTVRGGRNIITAEGALGNARYQDWKNYIPNGIAGANPSYKGSYVGQGVVISNGVTPTFDPNTGAVTNYSALQFATNTTPALVQDYVSKPVVHYQTKFILM